MMYHMIYDVLFHHGAVLAACCCWLLERRRCMEIESVVGVGCSLDLASLDQYWFQRDFLPATFAKLSRQTLPAAAISRQNAVPDRPVIWGPYDRARTYLHVAVRATPTPTDPERCRV